jgi:ribosomal-protein-alanine N-acetyltransferase
MYKSYETDRLILKELNKNDAAKVLSFYEDNKAFFEPWEPTRNSNFYTLPYQKASLTAESNLMSEGKLYRYWVFTQENPDEIIGCVCFQNILRDPYRSCSIGYKLGAKHLHLGYASESIKKGIEVMFEEHHMNRIEAYIMPNNKPSLSLIERLSFQYEGLCCSYAKVQGVWTDHKRYALINPKDNVTSDSEQ